MKTKTITIERGKPYSEKELNKIERALKKAEEARKDPKFMKAVGEFIKETT